MIKLRRLPRIWMMVLLLLGIGAILFVVSATVIVADSSGNKAKEHIRFAPVEPEHPPTSPQHAPVVPYAQQNMTETADGNALRVEIASITSTRIHNELSYPVLISSHQN